MSKITSGIHICVRCSGSKADYIDDEGFTWHEECYLAERRRQWWLGKAFCIVGALVFGTGVIYIAVVAMIYVPILADLLRSTQ